MSTQVHPQPPQLPELGELLRAAAESTMDAYDLPAARYRLQERLRSEGRGVVHRRRLMAVAAAASLALFVGVVALVSHRAEVRWSNQPVAPRPSASSTPTAAGIPVGIWRAPTGHVDQGRFYPTYLYLTVRPDSTGTVRVSEINEPIDVRLRRLGSLVRVEADPSLCSGGLLFAVDLTVRSDELVVNAAQPGPCYMNPSMVESLVGTAFVRQDQP